MQTAVLEEAAQGGTRPTIALKLNLSPETVKTHTRQLIAKTGDNSLASAGARLVRAALEETTRPTREETSDLPHAGDAPDDAETRTLSGERRLLSGVRERVSTNHRRNSPTLDVLRDQLYTTTIAEAGGNLTKAAERLGVSRQAIQQYVARKRVD